MGTFISIVLSVVLIWAFIKIIVWAFRNIGKILAFILCAILFVPLSFGLWLLL